jgi:hypothetical protein
VLIMATSLALSVARKGGHCASRRGSGTLVCQYGSGVMLPMVDSVEEDSGVRQASGDDIYPDCWKGFGLFAMFSFTSREPFNRESTKRFE